MGRMGKGVKMNKEIEEMAFIALKNTLSYTCAKQIAINFYNAGYRQIDENCAVITKAELKEYKTQAVKEFAEKLKERMGERDYMGVKYKQGVFSENEIDELLKDFEQ